MTKPIGRRTAHGDFESSLEGTQRVLLRGRNPALWLSQLHHICIVSVLMKPIIVFFPKFRNFYDIRYKTDIVFNKSFERKRKVATVNFDGNFESHLISFLINIIKIESIYVETNWSTNRIVLFDSEETASDGIGERPSVDSSVITSPTAAWVNTFLIIVSFFDEESSSSSLGVNTFSAPCRSSMWVLSQ